MEEALRFFKANEVWIYLCLGLLALWQIRKFVLAWNELRGALFGMERESAQSRLNQSAGMMVLILIMVIAEFMLVSFVVPLVPGALPIPSPTLDILATATTTLPAVIPGTEATRTVTPASIGAPDSNGCIEGQVMLKSPTNGEQVQGNITILGTATIPNFGFYKYEVSRPGESIWLPLHVGDEPKQDEELGTWDTSNLSPGVYQFRLVVTDNQGNTLSPCVIQVQVLSP